MAHAVRTPAGAAHEPTAVPRRHPRAAPKPYLYLNEDAACLRSTAQRPAASRQMETLYVHFADFRGSARQRAKQ